MRVPKRFEELTQQHMKPMGKSDTVRGELIRAVNKIGYRFYNDGDMLGIGYGNETCNAAGRYLGIHGSKEMVEILSKMWDEGIHDSGTEIIPEDIYEKRLEELEEATARYADTDDPALDQEATDMLDLRCDEDLHYDEEEEEDWWDYEEEEEEEDEDWYE